MRMVRILAFCAALLACAHTQEQAPAAAPKPEPVAQPTPPPAAAPTPAPAPEPVAEPAFRPPPAPPPMPMETLAASVYFAFDKYYLTHESRAALARLVDAASAAGTTVRIEGNCDERGSVEYNIALGQRRADAAKKYLVRLGVSEEQITAISYGKDRPKALGHDAKSWRENRRDDVFIISAPRVSQR